MLKERPLNPDNRCIESFFYLDNGCFIGHLELDFCEKKISESWYFV